MPISNVKVRLLVSSGNGPAECRIAVRHVASKMVSEAEAKGLDADVLVSDESSKHGPASVIITLDGEGADAVAEAWVGTVQWTAQSKVRPNHRRRNWFVGVFPLEASDQTGTTLRPDEVKYETLRAGGPGGQHQNTTDSAVRATHLPSGLSVVARNQRSQHRNKQAALKRLAEKLALRKDQDEAKQLRKESLLHHRLERGNPVRRFKGEKFVEV